MAAKKMGRPRIAIDKDEFEKLCGFMCTLNDIAGFFDCSIDTIENWCKATYKVTFSDIYKIKSGKGKASLRRWQFKNAEEGNATLQVWLGKNYLDQTDKQEVTFELKPTVIERTDGSKVVYGHVANQLKGKVDGD